MSEPVSRGMWIAIVVFQIMQIVAICMMGVKIYSSPDIGKPVYALIGQTVPPERVKEASENPDGLKLAYDVGVLEILSVGLTIIGVVFAVSAVAGFWMIRGAAVKAADKAARDEVKDLVPKLAREWFEREGRKIIAESAKLNQGSEEPVVGLKESVVAEVINKANEIGDV